jgi:hypothetical protein
LNDRTSNCARAETYLDAASFGAAAIVPVVAFPFWRLVFTVAVELATASSNTPPMNSGRQIEQ